MSNASETVSCSLATYRKIEKGDVIFDIADGRSFSLPYSEAGRYLNCSTFEAVTVCDKIGNVHLVGVRAKHSGGCEVIRNNIGLYQSEFERFPIDIVNEAKRLLYDDICGFC